MASKAKKPGKAVAAGDTAGLPAGFDDMERWMENFFRTGWLRPWRMEWPDWAGAGAPFGARMPKVDVIERDDEIVVRAEVPGVDKDDLDVSVSGNSVTIKGETKREQQEEKGEYHRSEIMRGSFLRTVALPGGVDADRVKSKFGDGVLELTFPRLEKTERRRISIA